ERWSSLSNAVVSIGQEIAVTPLQLAVATATIANGGELLRPQIVERVVDREDRVVWQPERPAPLQVVSGRTAAILNEILKGVVTRGTGQQARLAEHVAAGKTGTAQVPERGGYHPTKTIASFTGYAPADRPRVVILVVIEDPRGGGYGGTIAAPVFRAIAEGALRYLDVPASIPRREVEIAPVIRLAAFSQLRGEADPTSTAEAVGSPDSVVIPDFRGLDARLAVAQATRAGLEVRAVGRGVVAEQSPAPGATPERARVELIMSRGAEELNP
ncbi:MAG: penicillin-binding transpeptidase domain-containing protein, partial [Thermoanaerobaculia bacterium]